MGLYFYPKGQEPKHRTTLSLVPAAMLVAAVCVARSRWLRYGVAAYALWVAGITLVAFIG